MKKIQSPSLNRFVLALLVGSSLVVSSSQANADVSPKQVEEIVSKYIASDKGQKDINKAIEAYVKDMQAKAMAEQQKKQEDMQKQQQAETEKYFKNPISLDIGKSPVKGPESAKITIFEFSDFECPYCSRGASTIAEVLKAYPNDVKLVFKHLPLPMHSEAEPAARASFAANKQGKFWEFHDELFANQQSLGEDMFVKIATKLSLNVEQFKKDMASEEAKKQVEEDSAVAKKLEFQGTPGFVVGGVPVKGAYPLSHFKSIIDRKLK